MAASIDKTQVLDFFGVPSTQSNPPANTARMYYNQATNTFYVSDPNGNPLLNNGSFAGFVEDFTATTVNLPLTVTTSTEDLFDGAWIIQTITAGTTGTVAANNPADNIHIGALTLTTPATSGDGISISKSLNGTDTLPPTTAAGWVFDCWFQTPATITNYCIRIGLMGGAASDPATGGTWLEYDTANSSSNTAFTLRTVLSSASTYASSGVAPIASTWYHVQITTNGTTATMKLGVANAAPTTVATSITNITTGAQLPAVNVLPRSNVAVSVVVDRISFSYPTGRL
jgi:hypothetical protein